MALTHEKTSYQQGNANTFEITSTVCEFGFIWHFVYRRWRKKRRENIEGKHKQAVLRI